MCAPKMLTAQGQLSVYGNVGQTKLVTPWMLMYGASQLRATEEIRAITTHYGQQVVYRTAAVRTDFPSAWSPSGNNRTANGIHIANIDVSATTDQMWLQAGIQSKGDNAGSAAEGEAWCRLKTSLDRTGRIVVAQTVHVQPAVNSSEAAYVPLGRPIPAQDLVGFMGAFIVTSVSGTLAYGLSYRTFEADPSSPDSWTDLQSYTGVTSDETQNTGHEAVTPGTKLLAQPGLKFSGTDARATIQVVVAARWS